MNVEKFLELLASRLDAVVPDGYRVISDGDMLWWKRSGSYARQAYELYLDQLENAGEVRPGRDPRYEPISHEEIMAAVAMKAMDELQDTVAEDSHEPWPGDRTMPVPHAAIEDRTLIMWFGERERPVLRLDPIDLGELD